MTQAGFEPILISRCRILIFSKDDPNGILVRLIIYPEKTAYHQYSPDRNCREEDLITRREGVDQISEIQDWGLS